MRSLVYAKGFDEVSYISKSDKREFVPYKLITVQSEDEFFMQVEKLKPKQVIVDNYNFTLEHEKEFKRRFCAIKLTVFDDDYREHFCDEIINHNLGVNISNYKDVEKVKLIAPLVDEKFKSKVKIRAKSGKVFLSLGGDDSYGLSLKILKTVKNLNIELYTTSANIHLEKIQRYAFLHRNVKVHIDKDIAKGMKLCDVGIITPSTIAYEALTMKLPFVAIQVASNQDNLVKYLKRMRITVLDKDEIYKLKKVFLCKIELKQFLLKR